MEKSIYVTCQVKPTAYVAAVTGQGTKRYAVKCNGELQAIGVANDLFSLDGVSYVKFNKCGRFKHKDIVFCGADNYLKTIHDFYDQFGFEWAHAI